MSAQTVSYSRWKGVPSCLWETSYDKNLSEEFDHVGQFSNGLPQSQGSGPDGDHCAGCGLEPGGTRPIRPD